MYGSELPAHHVPGSLAAKAGEVSGAAQLEGLGVAVNGPQNLMFEA